MFTRNYWLGKAAYYANKSKKVFGDDSTIKPKLITVSGDVGGNVYTSSYKYKPVSTGAVTNSIHNVMKSVKTVDVSQNFADSSQYNHFDYGVFFGSGNEPVSIDDYKLSGNVVSGFTFSYNDESTYAEDGSYCIVRYNYTITNNNDSEITIGEVGLFYESTWYVRATSSAPYTHHYYMFERTALETPITIPAGGVGQVEYTIQMNYPVG